MTDPDEEQNQEIKRRPAIELDYAVEIGGYRKPPAPTAHPRFIGPVLALAAFAGIWSIILGVISLGEQAGLGLLLIGAGICLCWGTAGTLSAKNIRPHAALGLLMFSILLYLPAIVSSHRYYMAERSRHARELAADQSNWRELPTDAEHDVFNFALIRDGSIVSAALALGCCAYAVSRLVDEISK